MPMKQAITEESVGGLCNSLNALEKMHRWKDDTITSTLLRKAQEMIWALWGALNNERRKTMKPTATITLKKIPDCEGTNGRYYLELPDGYRLIYDNDGYVGRYDPNLNEVI